MRSPLARPAITRGMMSNGQARSMFCAVGVDGERDAHREDVELGDLLALLQLGESEPWSSCTSIAEAERGTPVGVEQFVPHPGLVRSSAIVMHPPCRHQVSAPCRDYDTLVNWSLSPRDQNTAGTWRNTSSGSW